MLRACSRQSRAARSAASQGQEKSILRLDRSRRPFSGSRKASSSPAAAGAGAPAAGAAPASALATASRRQLLAASVAPLPLGPMAARGAAAMAVAGGAEAAAAPGARDLLVVGPGVLGSYAGLLWKQRFPEATVTAQTNTEGNHDRLCKMGLSPVTRSAVPEGRRFPYVLFAAPPSGSDDYPAAVAAAAQQWDGSGALVFTSSMSVCATEDGSAVAEDCPLVPQGRSPATDRLLGAEAAALGAGGNVLRLVGLYHASRGPHTFFIRQGEVARWGGYTVNMLHYEDAARLAVAVLAGDGEGGGAGGFRGRVFVGADGSPLTFQEMVDACFESGQFQGSVTFTGGPEAGGRGKRVANDATRAALGGWEPKYPSFRGFFLGGGRDYYSDSGLF